MCALPNVNNIKSLFTFLTVKQQSLACHHLQTAIRIHWIYVGWRKDFYLYFFSVFFSIASWCLVCFFGRSIEYLPLAIVLFYLQTLVKHKISNSPFIAFENLIFTSFLYFNHEMDISWSMRSCVYQMNQFSTFLQLGIKCETILHAN